MRSARFVICALILIGLSACKPEDETGPTVEAPRPAKVAIVAYTEVDSGGSLVGEVAPRIESNLGFRAGGKIAERLVDVGDVVEAGAVLARLDPIQAQNALTQAQANVISAVAQKDNAEAVERRQKELLGRGFATQAAFDSATASANVARASLTAAQAALDNSREALSYMDLKADAAGVITAVGAEIGQVVAAGQMVVQLAHTDLRDAVFQVPERVLKAGAATTPVTVTLLDNPSARATGTVREISPAADPVTRTFRVKVGLDAPPEAFRFGSAVRGEITSTGPKLAALPLAALADADGRPAVWVADGDGAVSLTPVTVARYEGDRVLVASGVPEGAQVVSAGIQRLRPGMKVRPFRGAA